MAQAPDDDVDPRFDPRFQRGYDPARHPGVHGKGAGRAEPGLAGAGRDAAGFAGGGRGAAGFAGEGRGAAGRVGAGRGEPGRGEPDRDLAADGGSGLGHRAEPPADVASDRGRRAGVDVGDGDRADGDAGLESTPRRARILASGIALLVFAAVLIAAAVVLVQVGTAAQSAGQALVGRPDRFPDILIGTAPAPLAAAGCVGAVVGVALLLFAPRRRDAVDGPRDGGGRGHLPSDELLDDDGRGHLPSDEPLDGDAPR